MITRINFQRGIQRFSKRNLYHDTSSRGAICLRNGRNNFFKIRYTQHFSRCNDIHDSENLFPSMARSFLLVCGTMLATVGYGYYDFAHCMTSDEVMQYTPGETLLKNPFLIPVQPSKFCSNQTLIGAESRFEVYKDRSFVSGWMDPARYQDKFI